MPLTVAPPLTLALDDGEDGSESDEGDAPAGDVLAVRYSAVEVLRHQDMSALTAAEWAEAQRLIAALGIAAELRRPAGRVPPGTGRGATRICVAPCAATCAPAACRFGGPGGLRFPGPDGWCCSWTCRGAWSPTPGAWPVSPTPPSVPVDRAGSRCSPWAPA